MELKFTGIVPGLAFSQFEYKGDCEGFIKTLKEIETILPEIPDVFGVAPNNKADVITRLEKQNKTIIKFLQENPEVKVKFDEVKESFNKEEENGV